MLSGAVRIVLFFFLTAFCFSFGGPDGFAFAREDAAHLSAEERDLCLGTPPASALVNRGTRAKAALRWLSAVFELPRGQGAAGWSRESFGSPPLSKNDLYRQIRVYRL
jgi:hypothetical protein